MKRLFVLLAVALAVLFVAVIVAVNVSSYPLKYQKDIAVAASENGIEAPLVAAIIFAESGFNRNAKSQKGAIGLMQIMPQTAQWIAGELGIENYDLTDPKTNISFGCFYLRYLFTKFSSEIEVLCAYNAGEANAREWKTKSGETTEKNIPFPETKAYVKKVFEAKKYYSKKLG